MTTVNSARRLWALVAGIWIALVVTRILGPSDIWDKEQPRTIAYTVDMMRYGHYILPYDGFSIPATKPPLYNWLSLPFVTLLGFAEWVHKMPAILSSAALVITLMLFGRRLQPKMEGGAWAPAWTLGALAAAMWLATPQAMRISYLARPDMPLVALLTAAWAAASIMVEEDRPRPGMAAIFWLCTLGAALDKGPLALFPLVYLVLAALLIRRSSSALLRSGWWWGLPLVLVGSGLWVYAASRQEPNYVGDVLLGHEMAMRFEAVEALKTSLNSPAYTFTGFFPWSILVIGVLIAIGPRKWFSHPLAPAILWMFVITLGMCFASYRRRDWYAPVFPQMGFLSAAVVLGLISRTRQKGFKVQAAHAYALCMALVLFNVVFDWRWGPYSCDPRGENVAAFARKLTEKTRGEPILILDGERSGLEALMGSQQPEPPPADLLANAHWVVKNYGPAEAPLTGTPVAISGTIYDGEETPLPGPKRNVRGLRLALYRIEPGQGTQLYAMHERLPRQYDPLEGIAIGGDESRRAFARFYRYYPVERSPNQ